MIITYLFTDRNGPVVVPEMDFGEPGSSPWGSMGSYLTDADGYMPDSKKERVTESLPASKIRYYSYFLIYMLNQIRI